MSLHLAIYTEHNKDHSSSLCNATC